MIDLNKLEKQIDELIEQETSESLISWLLEKRIADLKKMLGEGEFHAFDALNEVVKVKSQANVVPEFLDNSFYNLGFSFQQEFCYQEAA